MGSECSMDGIWNCRNEFGRSLIGASPVGRNRSCRQSLQRAAKVIGSTWGNPRSRGGTRVADHFVYRVICNTTRILLTRGPISDLGADAQKPNSRQMAGQVRFLGAKIPGNYGFIENREPIREYSGKWSVIGPKSPISLL